MEFLLATLLILAFALINVFESIVIDVNTNYEGNFDNIYSLRRLRRELKKWEPIASSANDKYAIRQTNKLRHRIKQLESSANNIDNIDRAHDEGENPMTNTPKIVVVKRRLFWAIFFLIVPLLIAVMPYMAITQERNKSVSLNNFEFLALLLVTIGALSCIWSLGFRMVFDDDGITVTHKIRFPFFTVFEKSTIVFWGMISNVSFQLSGFGPIMVGAFNFSYIKKNNSEEVKRDSVYVCYIHHKNYRECLEYAVTKLPPEKINADAWQALRECGIAPPERSNPNKHKKRKR